MDDLMRFPLATRRDPAVETWLDGHWSELGAIARRWFQFLRDRGDDVRELMHDGHATACVCDAAFAYVGVFKAHVNVGFFRGSALDDPGRLLLGAGHHMRHVKLGPGRNVDAAALERLVRAAYADMQSRVLPQRP